jgi:hypothetical protein
MRKFHLSGKLVPKQLNACCKTGVYLKAAHGADWCRLRAPNIEESEAVRLSTYL